MQRRNALSSTLRRLRAGGALLFAAGLLSACSPGPKEISEAPPAVLETPAVQTQPVLTHSPPQTTEVQAALKRVFKDALILDTTRNPAFVAADFNGDQSQDLAAVVTPNAEKLMELNGDSPTWLLRDPVVPIDPRSPRLRVADREVLLAVIHGFGARGWRDPEATQTYLLKHVAGSSMRAHTLKDFSAANEGNSVPRFRGDLLGQILEGKPGYLYYADATYTWYDPKTYSPEPERRVVHAPMSAPMKK